jgi:hypothetical protein
VDVTDTTAESFRSLPNVVSEYYRTMGRHRNLDATSSCFVPGRHILEPIVVDAATAAVRGRFSGTPHAD